MRAWLKNNSVSLSLKVMLFSVCLLFAGPSGVALAQNYIGDEPAAGQSCDEGVNDNGICTHCGLNGEVVCPENGNAPPCSEYSLGFAPHFGICGRTDSARGDFSVRNCGFPGFPQCTGSEPTVACQVGVAHPSGLCAACGEYGQACCPFLLDDQCAEGACIRGRCRKTEEPDITGMWGSNIKFVYEVRQNRDRFNWKVISPDHIEETGSGTIERDENLKRWIVKATWSGNNGSGSAEGEIAEIGSDRRAGRIVWSNGVTFSRDEALRPASDETDQAEAQSTIEPNTDRMGMDYANFDLAASDPQLCRDACLKDPGCRAWTFVRPPKQGPKPRCWLKHGVPKATGDPLCVSGVVVR